MHGAVIACVLLGASAAMACSGSQGDAAGARASSAEAEAEAKVPEGDAAKSKDVKSGDAKRDDEGGIADQVRAIAKGSDPRDPVLPAGKGVAAPATIPPGDVLIEHECSHSMQPFGTGYWSSTITVDLAKAVVRTLRIEGDTDLARFPPGTSPEKRTETETPLSPADVTRIRAALDRMLSGGPYEPVYALSEGIVCTLELRVGSDPPFFTIDKSREGPEDSVTRLINSLGAMPAP